MASGAFGLGAAQRQNMVFVISAMALFLHLEATRVTRAVARWFTLRRAGTAIWVSLGLSLGGATVPLLAADAVSVQWLGGKAPLADTGVSWGVPWPQGAVHKGESLALTAADGTDVPLQTWPLAYWPDGSLKWTGLAAVVPAGTTALTVTPGKSAIAGTATVAVQQNAEAVTVNTGPVVCRIPTHGSALIDSLTMDNTVVARDGRLVCVVQNAPDHDTGNPPQRVAFTSVVEKVTVEQSGPVRAVVKIEGRHHADQGRAADWLPFTVRLYFYAGQAAIRMVHTFIFDGDAQKDFVRGLGLTFAVPMRQDVQYRHVRFSGENGGLWAEPIQPGAGDAEQQAGKAPSTSRFYGGQGDYAIWSDFKLTQPTPDGFTIFKRTNPQSTWLFSAAGQRASGLAFVGDTTGGLGVSIKNFWQSYPSGLEVRGAGGAAAELTAWLWSPDGGAMDMRHYDTKAHGLPATYEDVQPGLSTPYGVARTSELTLFPTREIPSKPDTAAMAACGTRLPLLVASPAYLHSTGVFGVWSLPDRSTPLKATVEDRLDSVLAYYEQQVDERRWYGFWQYGDFIHSYNRAGHVWYYDFGGHAWDNTELGAPLWLWYSFLRTGREDLFRLAEALTRNTSETCVYHLGPMAGLGSRHNVIKWGDGAKEARISQSAHWRPYYYLTTDERVGDIMHANVHADVAAMRYDPMREAQPMLPQDPKYPGRIRIGPDWFALAGNWMTEWERTGDTHWRDRILAGVDSILAMPFWIRSGVLHGLNPDIPGGGIGPLKGGGSMTVGYDPATGKLLPIPDPVTHGQVAVNYNLSTIQGGAEVMFELVPLLGRADWAKAWLQYCRLSDAPAEVLTKDRETGTEGADARYVERAQGGPRLAAYAYAQTRDAAFAQRAIVQGLARYGGAIKTQLISGPDALNPVHEAPFVSTNDASQSSLSAIEILQLCADALPQELPPPPPMPEFMRRGGPRNRNAERTASPSPNTPASSRPAEAPRND